MVEGIFTWSLSFERRKVFAAHLEAVGSWETQESWAVGC